MTKNQVEERLIAMGLPTYSEKDLEDFRRRKEEEEKRRQEAMKKAGKIEISAPEESSVDNEKIVEKAEAESEEQEQQKGYRSFEEIKRAIKIYIRNRKSTIALDIARYYSIERHSDFLTEEERKKLEAMADTIKIFRDRDRVRKAKER